MGDLNAGVGDEKMEGVVGVHGVPRKNDSGERLIEMCTEREMGACSKLLNVSVRRGESGGMSDHYLVEGMLRVGMPWVRSRKSGNAREVLREEWQQFKSAVVGCAEGVCGVRRVGGGVRKVSEWWCEDVRLAVTEKRRAYEVWLQRKDREKCYKESCARTSRPELETTFIYIVLSTITVLTVVLNLLVIISIAHFRQLHTCTNFLLLSLAAADFLVGSLQMPLQIFYHRGCWMLGDIPCAVYFFSGYFVVGASCGNMTLISVDRYIAICEPMLYHSKVTCLKLVPYDLKLAL
ncbi:hypothetical protein WMY93_013924 [Mugilogobius chulae]|uniref:G-protein coupled receptors family 1 profile domain-containing protein n=1 Tax=Mugilogobius chulae TaxID=88201 RepID=A0AAW0P1M9_9GOBI